MGKKVILIHGNGNCTPHDNWFPYLKNELERLGISVIAEQFPDAQLARAHYWIPFLRDSLHADKDSVLVGHSSGAIAAMRCAESTPILGSVLIGSYVSDLGMDTEKSSGYFDTPWNWNAIKEHQQWIVQFSSSDDPWIPIDEARTLHDKLNTEYYEYSDQGHFGGDYHKPTFPELLNVLKKKLLT